MRVTRVPLAAVLALCVLSTTACAQVVDMVQPRPLWPVAVQNDRGSLRVALCAEMIADRVTVALRNESTGGDWYDILAAHDQGALAAGTMLELSDSGSLAIDGELRPYALAAGDEISIALDDSSGGGTLAYFPSIDWAEVGDRWIYTGRRMSSSAPCAYYDLKSE